MVGLASQEMFIVIATLGVDPFPTKNKCKNIETNNRWSNRMNETFLQFQHFVLHRNLSSTFRLEFVKLRPTTIAECVQRIFARTKLAWSNLRVL